MFIVPGAKLEPHKMPLPLVFLYKDTVTEVAEELVGNGRVVFPADVLHKKPFGLVGLVGAVINLRPIPDPVPGLYVTVMLHGDAAVEFLKLEQDAVVEVIVNAG